MRPPTGLKTQMADGSASGPPPAKRRYWPRWPKSGATGRTQLSSASCATLPTRARPTTVDTSLARVSACFGWPSRPPVSRRGRACLPQVNCPATTASGRSVDMSPAYRRHRKPAHRPRSRGVPKRTNRPTTQHQLRANRTISARRAATAGAPIFTVWGVFTSAVKNGLRVIAEAALEDDVAVCRVSTLCVWAYFTK